MAENEQLKKVYTGNEMPVSFLPQLMMSIPHQRPPFNFYAIRDMLTDPRIHFGLSLIKGPIHSFTKFFNSEESDSENVHRMIVESELYFPYKVSCEKKEIEEFAVRNLRRFWQLGVIKALTALEFGYSGHEVIYRDAVIGDDDSKKYIVFDNLKRLSYQNLRAVTKNGALVGLHIKQRTRNLYIGIPKSFWHVHAREVHPIYGSSRLWGAYPSWWQIWSEGGARDVVKTWYHRNAFDGGTMYYPHGYTQLASGEQVPNVNLATEMLAKKRAGGYFIFPNEKDDRGKQSWEYDPPAGAVAPQGLLEYLKFLTKEELEGMGIPPEVVEQAGSGGLGSATGRKVPMVAFMSTLQTVTDFLINDFRQQILTPMINVNYGKPYEVWIEPIVPTKAFEENKEPVKGPTESTESNTGMSE